MKIIRWTYPATVRPMIAHGAVIWAGRTKLAITIREPDSQPNY